MPPYSTHDYCNFNFKAFFKKIELTEIFQKIFLRQFSKKGVRFLPIKKLVILSADCLTTEPAKKRYLVRRPYATPSEISILFQIRIDFLSFSLAQPNANGTCNTDAMYVIGGASQVPVICGENSGQHIYVDFNGDSDIQIIIDTNSGVSFARSWNLKISQIGCDCPTRGKLGNKQLRRRWHFCNFSSCRLLDVLHRPDRHRHEFKLRTNSVQQRCEHREQHDRNQRACQFKLRRLHRNAARLLLYPMEPIWRRYLFVYRVWGHGNRNRTGNRWDDGGKFGWF